MHTFYYVPNEQESTENIPRSLLVDEGEGLQKYYTMRTRSRHYTSGRNKRTRKINKQVTSCNMSGSGVNCVIDYIISWFFFFLKYKNKYSWFLSLSPQQNLSKEFPRDFLLLLMTSLHFSHFRSGVLGGAKFSMLHTCIMKCQSRTYICTHVHHRGGPNDSIVRPVFWLVTSLSSVLALK